MHEGEEDHIHLDDGTFAYTGERVELTSVGIDIGSSTTHLIFSGLVLERQGKRLSSRYIVTERNILSRSPVIFTPFAPSGQIDAPALARFIAEAYGAARLAPDDVDGGAVITTGEAALRDNAQAVGELFSREGGQFVVATAGPNLESLLAAHGSGAAELSLQSDEPLLNVDIGGGTTKFAVCRHGEVQETAALHLGARLIAWDAHGCAVRVEEAARRAARQAGLKVPALGDHLSGDLLDRLADYMAERIVQVIRGDRHDGAPGFWITPILRETRPFGRVVFSGGVAEYVYDRETREFGDLGPRLAQAVRRLARADDIQLLEPVEAIRATCIGASQYTVQLSGDTIFLSHPEHLPLRSIPVAAVTGITEPSTAQVAEAVRRALHRLDLDVSDGDQLFALGLEWRHGADYTSLRALCAGLTEALPEVRQGRPLLLIVDSDVAGLIGALLQEEFKVDGSLVCIDQVRLREFDYIDIGRRLPAQDVVPVVVKSLVFR
jgi:ethanolamine utilization protein EutA